MSDSEEISWGNLADYECAGEAKLDKLSTAPSAGTVRIEFELDGSNLPSTSQSGRVLISAWSSLNRRTDVVPVAWQANSKQTKSRTLAVKLNLDDEYQLAQRRREAIAIKSVTAPLFELGSLRTDSNVWFEVLVEEPSLMTNSAVYGRYGAGFVSVAELVELSRGGKSTVQLVLFDAKDKQTEAPMSRASMNITRVHFGKHTAELQKLAATQRLLTAEPSMFELNAHNLPFVASLTGAAIGRHLYSITNNDNLQLRGTRTINTRVVAPWYQTHQPSEGLNRLPIHGYFIDQHALNPLPSDAPDDERYLLAVFGYAARRDNMTLTEMEAVMHKQMARSDDTYDPLFTKCLANIARGFVLMSNTFSYQSDMHNMTDRLHRFTKPVQQSDESWNRAQRNAGGDCEDLARYAYSHAQMLRRGQWNHSFLIVAQQVLHLYVPVMMLGTVTSPALGNKHDASKSAVHLADAEHHHTIIKAMGGADKVTDHMVRSEAARVVHKHVVIGSPEDLALPVGGHSWMEMVPRHKFIEYTRRLVPETKDDNAVKNVGAPWRYFVPHLVLEGTGRINPLFMPSAYYATPGQDRDALRRADLASMRTHHALIANSPVFHGMQSEAQPTSTVNTPHERTTSFYVQSTQSFTDEFLDSTGCVAFNWFQLKADEPVHEQSVDPLFAREDALSAKNLRTAAANFVHSAAADAAKPKSAVEALNGVNHADLLDTLAVGALVGENEPLEFDPSHLTLGVDLEQRLMDRPYASNIALLPTANIEPMEAKALASQLRQCYPDEKPSSRLSNFATDPALPIAFVRESPQNRDVADPRAMAKLVLNEKLVTEQRRYVQQTVAGVRQLFVNEPWLGRKAAEKRSLNLQTFYLSPADITNERAPAMILNEVARFKQAGVVKTARAYVEEPTQHFQTLVIQMLCVEAQSNDDK